MTPKDNEAQRPEEAAVPVEPAAPTPESTSETTSEPTPTEPDSAAAEDHSVEEPTESAPASEEPSAAVDETPAETPVEPAVEEKATSTEAPAEPAAEEKAISAEETPAETPMVEMATEPPAEPAPAVESSSTEAKEAPADEALEPAKTDPEVAKALKKSAAGVKPSLRVGKRMRVTVVQVGEKDSFVDFGGRSEGTIASSELRNEKGEFKYNVGDEINAVVRKTDDTPVFSLGRRRVPANLSKVKEAFEQQAPMEGKVKSTNKGGFEVDLHGVRAFCPFSQIQLGYCENPEDYVGQKLPFMVITFERGGRNIVLSRRKLLQEESKASAEETLEKLEEGAVFDGVVRRLQPYGAFVDIGGIDGLVHVSEISHGRVVNPQDLLKVGEKVRVQVIKLEGEGNKRRISLSMKELESDPWENIEERFALGATVPGKIVRLTDFGAFVELGKGIDGLIHISEISTERIQHPSEKLQKGQEVEVRVLRIDPEQRRISLSLLSEEQSQEAHQHRAPRRAHPSGGDRVDSSLRHHRSSTPEEKKQPKQDVTKMPFEDALEALKNKFRGD